MVAAVGNGKMVDNSKMDSDWQGKMERCSDW